MIARLVAISFGLAALALGSFCRRAIVSERRRRAGREVHDALATWEEEGGALPATARRAGYFESSPHAAARG